ncbi:ATP-binding cassette domain-containing protein [Nocardioides immobilis]|uniref:ATP-binding cassette domain-containing protein n=1 Tax=Nocardioides immobilis TaxID=2049295 RepID=A0A417XW68_9ACTN|nr:branched-chain amino acid ABC transporter permease/ATP-binding protein [Nocardioides immobilis]RHW24623.1 ATP-binding cassette domain-containing protein [Nocardioides immobilis]
MTDVLRYALLGLGTGGIYALLAVGLVVIYRGSGVINFAHAGFALVGAYMTYHLQTLEGHGLAFSLTAAVLLTAVLGVLTHHLVMRPLRGASPLARVIATLGLLTVLTQAVQLKYGTQQLLTRSPLPNDAVTVATDVVVGRYAFWLVGIAVVTTLVLTVVSARTRMGHAISAAAENPRGAAALGWAPDLLASVTWAIGGGLAALAGGLFPATTFGFLSPVPFGVLIIGALATALLGGFRSYPLALVGGLLIGAAQSATRHWTNQTGVPDAVPFLVIIVVLVLRGRGLPLRGSVTDRLPRVGTGRIRPALVLVLAGVAMLWVGLGAPADWYAPTIISATFALIGLSIVVLTGYAGQLSIAQFALAGIGAFAAGRLAAFHGWRFEPALVAGVVVAMAVGLLFALPALRTRGVNLAVVTFGLGFAVHQIVFSNSDYTAKVAPGEISLFGLDIEPIGHARNYALVCLLLLTLTALVVANVRRGRSGRRLLAVRTNERAAAAIGVNVFEAKLYAFTLSAGIAGLGGVLLGFSYPTILYPQVFEPGASITVLVLTVIGSIGYLVGPFIGALSAPGGLITLLGSDTPAVAAQADPGWQQYLPLAAALALVLTLILSQHGAAESLDAATRRLRARIPGLRPGRPAPLPATVKATVPAGRLTVHGLTQRFGGFTALDAVDLTVGPGEVVGLLGPNGAGKTTLIDCVAGNNRVTAGSIRWGDRDITRWAPYRRARAGLSRSFQSLELFDDLTVRENLLAAADRRDRLAYLLDLVRPGRPTLPGTVVAAVDELGLAPLLDTRAQDLSYGQRRLVAIARAVASSPSVLLLDEPAAGLDETESTELGRLIRRLADEWGMGILLIEHDVALVLANADRVVVLDFGHKIAEGTPSEIRNDTAVRRAYLGEEEQPVSVG